MSEIGSGSGSSYPTALDTDNTPEVNSPAAGKTKARKEVVNDLASCIVAIETELGTNPSGTLSDVKTFLQTEHATDGTHNGITTDTLSATGVITSTLATGTAPFTIASTTKVVNLNADKLDDVEASATPTADTIVKSDGSGKLAIGWMFSGAVLQSVITTDFNTRTTTTAIPRDGTTPLWDEGTEVSQWAVTITPKSNSSTIKVTISTGATNDGVGVASQIAMFKDPSGTDAALAAGDIQVATGGYWVRFTAVWKISSWSGAGTLKFRIGSNNGSNTASFGGGSTYGGLTGTQIFVEELNA